MDEMAFLEPVRVGDLVHVKAQVNWTGRSSMEVGVRVLAERWNESTPATQVGTAYLVFAAVDEEGKPRPVPPVLPETERDKRRYQEAQIRRTHRLARRRAIMELRESGRPRASTTEARGGPAGTGHSTRVPFRRQPPGRPVITGVELALAATGPPPAPPTHLARSRSPRSPAPAPAPSTARSSLPGQRRRERTSRSGPSAGRRR